MNTVAVLFVLDIDDIIHKALVPSGIGKLIEELPAIPVYEVETGSQDLDDLPTYAMCRAYFGQWFNIIIIVSMVASVLSSVDC